MSVPAKFFPISPDVLILGNKRLNLKVLPGKALLKVHTAILEGFDDTKEYPSKLMTHLNILRALNDMSAGDVSTAEVELFRTHIVKFCGSWYEHVEMTRVAGFLPRLNASTAASSAEKKIQPWIEVDKQVAGATSVVISDTGGLSLVDKGPAVSDELTDLKTKIANLKTRLIACGPSGSDEGCEAAVARNITTQF